MPPNARHRRKPVLELTPEREALIKEVLSECKKTAAKLTELRERRNTLFREMYEEGWSIAALAKIAGVSPQRMSKVINPPAPKGRPARRRMDDWL